jgi:hypothetical protein
MRLKEVSPTQFGGKLCPEKTGHGGGDALLNDFPHEKFQPVMDFQLLIFCNLD